MERSWKVHAYGLELILWTSTELRLFRVEKNLLQPLGLKSKKSQPGRKQSYNLKRLQLKIFNRVKILIKQMFEPKYLIFGLYPGWAG
jgi:hypothetical protein